MQGSGISIISNKLTKLMETASMASKSWQPSFEPQRERRGKQASWKKKGKGA